MLLSAMSNVRGVAPPMFRLPLIVDPRGLPALEYVSVPLSVSVPVPVCTMAVDCPLPPPSVREAIVSSKPLRSSVPLRSLLPATVTADPSGSTLLAPLRSTPSLTIVVPV